MISWIVQGVISLGSNYIKYQRTKVELKRKVEIARLEAKAEVEANRHEAQMAMLDADAYSEQARQKSMADEAAMIILLVFFVYSFLNPVEAMEILKTFQMYPLWLQIIYVGVFVSLFGLRGMFESLGNTLRGK